MLAALSLSACKPPEVAAERRFEVRFRPDPAPSSSEATWLLERVPGATWDRGLARAVSHLTGAATDRGARLTPRAMAQAKALSGYPGNARFARELTGGGWPEQLVGQLQAAATLTTQPVDVALGRRTYGDGMTLWIGAVAQRPVFLDPIPRDLELDELLPLHLEVLDANAQDPLARASDALLFVAPPHGPVQSYPLETTRARWIDAFHEPGPWRLEVVSRTERDTQVLLWWTHFVESDPEPLALLPRASTTPPDPMEATEALYEAVNVLRKDAGLRPLTRFTPFEPLAREHAAWMASHGTVGHTIPGVTQGVAARAASAFHPRARHREDLAASWTWQEALDIVSLSPGHLRNLLCETCSHLSVGVALEPVVDRPARLFVVWEVLEFPQGKPQRGRSNGRMPGGANSPNPG